MNLPSLLSVSPIYIALLGLLFFVITLRVGIYRVKINVNIGNGDDPELLRRVRGQGNFTETVPMALFLLITMEVLGASDTWLHILGAALVLGRISHYLGLTEIGPNFCRPLGMAGTMITILVSSIWIMLDVL
ncbi:MAG: glutathione S-transferase [Oceanicoccus sp.]|uniref:MAPEG family protein n=1 Tax=Oceanicoccus sp. TaxID=2691044 RepID=UPI00260874C5|nr:MAPEG family protein [Oceanicoccus sp.]MCP3906547.1 glutathione S-transferase [Oceanicoccus sp.]MDG1773380.1 MAPEG family protein [Oceanicoccus sp.]